MPTLELKRQRRSLFSLLSLLALVLLPLCAHARPEPIHPPVNPRGVDGHSLGTMLDLSSTWLFHQGDDPHYANPKLDDSQWLVFVDGNTLQSYGLTNVDAVWFRTHVHLQPGLHHLGISQRTFYGSLQIFVNGVEVGAFGTFAPGGPNSVTPSRVYEIPDFLIASGDVTIAIRARVGRISEYGHTFGGFGEGTMVLLGDVDELRETTSLFHFRDLTSNFSNIILELLVMLIALALAFTMREQREYLALAIYLGATALTASIVVWAELQHPLAPNLITLLRGAFDTITMLAIIEFVRLVLGLRRTRLLLAYEILIVVVLGICGTLFGFYLNLHGDHSPRIALAAAIVSEIVSLPVDWGLPLLALLVWFRKRNPDALLLSIPLLCEAVLLYYQVAHYLLFEFRILPDSSIPEPPVNWMFLGWTEVSVFFFNISLLVFLVVRTLRLARLQAATVAEIHAAQSVQQLLLARASQLTPGFDVHSVYLPADEVGGDFFLVSPNPSDDSITAIVGDVSGHGLTAAMRVSMILGALRREDARDPASILQSLNEALLTQGEMGFTTACCVRLERTGHFRLANAGHIAPYLAGAEIVTPPALPLGLASGQTYETVEGQLPPSERLVLMSDGIPEARSRKGELYGFDRLNTLTRMPARDIAQVAQRFGQEDDITVLTLACLPA